MNIYHENEKLKERIKELRVTINYLTKRRK